MLWNPLQCIVFNVTNLELRFRFVFIDNSKNIRSNEHFFKVIFTIHQVICNHFESFSRTLSHLRWMKTWGNNRCMLWRQPPIDEISSLRSLYAEILPRLLLRCSHSLKKLSQCYSARAGNTLCCRLIQPCRFLASVYFILSCALCRAHINAIRVVVVSRCIRVCPTHVRRGCLKRSSQKVYAVHVCAIRLCISPCLQSSWFVAASLSGSHSIMRWAPTID